MKSKLFSTIALTGKRDPADTNAPDKAADGENVTLQDQAGQESADKTPALFAKLGAEMYAMTTTAHSASISFEDQVACIPAVWQHAVDSLRIQLAPPSGAHSDPHDHGPGGAAGIIQE